MASVVHMRERSRFNRESRSQQVKVRKGAYLGSLIGRRFFLNRKSDVSFD